LGFTGILLGAFGAHALKSRLEAAGTVDIWRTAVEYHLVHAVALLALAIWIELRLQRVEKDAAGVHLLIWTGRCWVAGVVCFSGSLYILALGGPHWLGPITPLGGLAFLAGWVLVLPAVLKPVNN
jgi:uncharacterized membrane protein YgdD (TMEM256/DUF423 family)